MFYIYYYYYVGIHLPHSKKLCIVYLESDRAKKIKRPKTDRIESEREREISYMRIYMYIINIAVIFKTVLHSKTGD